MNLHVNVKDNNSCSGCVLGWLLLDQNQERWRNINDELRRNGQPCGFVKIC